MKRFFKTLFLVVVLATMAYAADRLYRAPVTDSSRGVPALDPNTPSTEVDVSPRAHYER